MVLTLAIQQIVRDIKEQHGYIAEDFASECNNVNATPKAFEREYTMPDGVVISLGDARYKFPFYLN
jgi:hypothetical protein